MNNLISFDCDPETRKRLEDVARMTGIQNNAATLRYIITRVYKEMMGETPDTVAAPAAVLDGAKDR